MTAPRQRSVWEPLTMTWSEAADVAFRKSENWLRVHIDEFEGFPRPHPKTNLFLGEQVRDWVRAQFGVMPSSASGLAELALERAKRGARAGAISRRQG